MNITNTISDRKWLDERFKIGVEENNYLAHQPIFGLNKGNTEPGHLFRMARVYHLLKLLNKLDFENFIDIGGGKDIFRT